MLLQNGTTENALLSRMMGGFGQTSKAVAGNLTGSFMAVAARAFTAANEIVVADNDNPYALQVGAIEIQGGDPATPAPERTRRKIQIVIPEWTMGY